MGTITPSHCYWKCERCGKEVDENTLGCINNTDQILVRFGEELQIIDDERCPYCLVKRGEFHHKECEIEQCYYCGLKVDFCVC